MKEENKSVGFSLDLVIISHQSFPTPISRVQLTFKLSQMSFKKYYQLVNFGDFGGFNPKVCSESGWKSVTDALS